MLELAWRMSRALLLGVVAALGSSSPTEPAEPPPSPPPQSQPEKVRAPLPLGRVQIHVAHALGRDEARKRMEKLVLYWGKYGIHGQWDGDSAEISGAPLGIEVSANVDVADDSVDGTVKDPGPLLRDRAVDYVHWKIGRYLDPQVPCEALPIR